MPPKKSPTYYRAKEGFTVDDKELGLTVVHKGEIVRAGHSLLKGREEHFEPVESFGRFDVEQATAAPGEKRG